jgi:uncharacterized protein (TIGR02594 family)
VQPSSEPELSVPRWVAVALREIGVVEDVRPGKSHPRIEAYHAVTRGGASPDDVPWCSSLVCWTMEQAGIPSTRSKAAASWATWGEAVMPRLGAVVLFGKSDPDAKGTGHVGIALGVSGGEVYVLGGNQKNRVSVATRKVRDAVAWRWPTAQGSTPPRAA